MSRRQMGLMIVLLLCVGPLLPTVLTVACYFAAGWILWDLVE